MSYTELQNKVVKARKDISCEWCPEDILKGEEHRYRAYKLDGDFVTGRMHSECYQAACKCDFDGGYFFPHEFKRGTAEER